MNPTTSRNDAMEMVLDCPKCHAPGRAHWNKLAGCLRCKACGVNFELGKDGKVRLADLASDRCPRCSSNIRHPKRSGRIRCPACKFEVVVNAKAAAPSKPRQHTSAQSLERPKPKGSSNRRRGGHRDDRTEDGRRLSRGVLLGGGAISAVVVALCVWWGLAGRLDPALQGAVREFMGLALQGNTETAQSLVVPGQEADFRNWYRLSFRRVLQEHSLSNAGKMRISLEERAEGCCWVAISIQQTGDDDLVIYQAWMHTDNGWQLNARETAKRARQSEKAKSIKVQRSFKV